MPRKSDTTSGNNCDLGFLSLRPCDQAFTEEPCAQQRDQIENARTAFLRNCFFDAERPLVNQQRLINKPAFILDHIDDIQIPDVLFSLICDRNTLFSDGYSDYMLNHKVMRENRKISGRNPEERHQRSVAAALAEYQRMRPQKYEQNSAVFKDALDKINRYRLQAHNPVGTCYKQLRASIANVEDGQEAKPLLTVLKSWDPDIQLEETNVFDFFAFAFQTYRQQYNESLLIGQEAGHYKVRHTLNDYREFQEYERRKNICTTLFSAIKIWTGAHQFPFCVLDRNSGNFHFSDEMIKNTSLLLQEYLSTTRSKINKPKQERVVEVLQFAMTQERYAAFRFLVLCIGGCGAIFTNKTEDWEPIYSVFPKHIYRAKPARSTQRTERLKLLCGLCRELQMDSTTVQDNLLYFLLYHGFEILSEQEAEIWKDVLKQYDLQEQPVSLALRCWDYLQECLPFSPSDLFCYQSGSQLHLDGFLAFCEEFPRSIAAPSGLLRIVPDDLVNWYLSEWGSYQPDIPAIQEKCRHESFMIQENAAMRKWVNQWDKESKQGKHKVPYPIEWDELRALLLECAIRRKIIDQAQTKLKNVLFNNILGELRITD